MGIFTRFRDIISSNINAMLDRAEDPEKLIKLMIREMEDTLVEIKAACAGVMAESKKVQRQLEEIVGRVEELESRIDRMESEADLVNIGRKSDLEEELDKLNADEEIEAELQALKKPAVSQSV
ncbi:MAG: PspA/IM30 family protein [Desulfobacterales bacterium]